MASKIGRPKATLLPLSAGDRSTAEAAVEKLAEVVACRRELQRQVARAARAVRLASSKLMASPFIGDVVDVFELVDGGEEHPESLSHEDCVLLCGLAQLVAEKLLADEENTASMLSRTLGEQLAEALAELDLFDANLVQYWQSSERRDAVSELAAPTGTSREPVRLARLCDSFVRAGGLTETGLALLRTECRGHPASSEGTAALHAYTALLLMEVARLQKVARSEAATVVLEACSHYRVIRAQHPQRPSTGHGVAARALVGVLVGGSDPHGETWVREQAGKVSRAARDYMELGREAATKEGQREKGDTRGDEGRIARKRR